MHPSALRNAKLFFQTYSSAFETGKIVDIGSQDVNGSLKEVAPKHMTYIGVDFVGGRNVDVQLTDPYKLPFEDDSIDIVVSNSCFEHSEMFWVLFLEALRILRPNGLLYFNAPSNGRFHRWPVDCWRFYPDSGQALVTWARYNHLKPQLLESFVCSKFMGLWNDFIAVYVKDEAQISLHQGRMMERSAKYFNARLLGSDDIIALEEEAPDQSGILDRLLRYYWRKSERGVMRRIRE